MAIMLDHVIVPSRNRVAGAKLLAELLDVPWEEAHGAQSQFTPVYVNDALTLDFAQRETFASHHFCFRVSDREFDRIFERIKARNITYRSHPRGENDMQINTRMGGKNVYWEDADGHLWEILTVSYARPVARSAAVAG
jgi:catechol 2,3-dioxygenase-like lactoylglutathione lyase family enzyme